MNFKFILTFLIITNFLSVAFASYCDVSTATCQTTQDTFVSKLFKIPKNINYNEAYGVGVSRNLSQVSQEMLSPQPAGAKVTEGFSLFLDGIKMILGVLILLTPLPILDLLNGFGIPLMLIGPLALPLFLMYLVGIIEMVRGASFGK